MLNWIKSLLHRKMYKGHDLNKWKFLGTTDISFTEDGQKLARATFYYFYNENNNKRSFYLAVDPHTPKYFKFSSHQYTKIVKDWKYLVDEYWLGYVVSNPSIYLIEHLKPTIGWDAKNNKWFLKNEYINNEDNIIKFPSKK